MTLKKARGPVLGVVTKSAMSTSTGAFLEIWTLNPIRQTALSKSVEKSVVMKQIDTQRFIPR